jgi:hypothetical protein
VNAKRGGKVVGAAGWNDEEGERAVDDRREMTMNGAVAAEDDSNLGARAVVSPRDGRVRLKRTQMRLIYMRSDDSDGAQAGAG